VFIIIICPAARRLQFPHFFSFGQHADSL